MKRLKKLKKNSKDVTSKTSSKKRCPYHDDVFCDGVELECKHCLRSQTTKEEYDEFTSQFKGLDV